jgi:DNA-binding NarL/FixJ family response regulator
VNSIRVLIADDQDIFRAGIRTMLAGLEGVEVAAEAVDGREALSLVGRDLPDIVLAEIAMPNLDGLLLTRAVARDFPKTRVIILNDHDGKEQVRDAFRAGAAGYLLKDSGLMELEFALRAVARGLVFLTPSVTSSVVDDFVRHRDTPSVNEALLTPRQLDVLRLISQGFSTKEVALRLGLSAKTVETHRTLLMTRLGIRNMAGLVQYALRVGIMELDR